MEQEEIVAEIEGYQKITDGAQQVVDNYKPAIKINPDWEMVPLGKIVKVDGKMTHDLKDFGNEYYIGGDNIESNTGNIVFLSTIKEKGIRGPAYKFRKDQILYSKLRPYLNKATIIDINGYCSSDMYPLTVNSEMAISQYVLLFLLSTQFLKSIEEHYQRARMPKINKAQLYSVLIPLPSQSVQQEIVSQIEEEQKIVNANKKLIAIYEQRIKDKIKEVWGE